MCPPGRSRGADLSVASIDLQNDLGARPRTKWGFFPLFFSKGKKLMQALAFVVKGLKKPDTIIPVIQDLGRRHVHYGVEDAHYDTVGAALLWTLEKGLGEAWTAEVQEVWTARSDRPCHERSSSRGHGRGCPGWIRQHSANRNWKRVFGKMIRQYHTATCSPFSFFY